MSSTREPVQGACGPDTFSTADLCDLQGEAVEVAEPIFRDFGGRTHFAGPAETVKCFEDNSRIKEALAEPGQGRVLVVDAGGSRRCAVLGDALACRAQEQGWAGVVLYGCVRDSVALAGLDLGIKALAALPRRSVRRGEGQRSIPVAFAGLRIEPGDRVYCDPDGIVVTRQPVRDRSRSR